MRGKARSGSMDIQETLERIADDPASKPPKGRLDASGQEKVINKKALADAIEELERSYIKATEASGKFSDMVKKVAEKSGLLASVVKKIVKARVDDNFEEKQREAEQLVLIFQEIGED